MLYSWHAHLEQSNWVRLYVGKDLGTELSKRPNFTCHCGQFLRSTEGNAYYSSPTGGPAVSVLDATRLHGLGTI